MDASHAAHTRAVETVDAPRSARRTTSGRSAGTNGTGGSGSSPPQADGSARARRSSSRVSGASSGGGSARGVGEVAVPRGGGDGGTAAAAKKKKTKAKGKKKRRRGTVAICLSNCKYEVIEDCALDRGWRIIDDEDSTYPWNVYWTDTSVSTERVMALQSFQKINHFPGMSTLSRKAGLARNLTRMRAAFPKEFNFFPDTWTLPAEYQDFKDQFSRKGTKTFIVKPDHGCQGKGIFLTRSWEAVDPAEPQVAQRYIRKPLLIDGFKFDLRIYILVLSCDPLRVYMYDDGLTRLCTEEYEEPHSRNLTRMCMHLTNYAVNKGNDNFVYNTDADSDGVGSKRSLLWFRRWLAEQGHDVDVVWRRIDHMIIKTLISVQPALAHTYRSCLPSDDNTGFSCFEVLGLDVMVDSKLRPWLIEVNHSPSFGCDTPLDLRIKSGLIKSTYSMLHVSSSDRRKAQAQQSAEAQSRLYSGVFTPARKSVDTKDVRAAAVARVEAWEKKHLGGYRRIFPPTQEGVDAGAWPEAAYRPLFMTSQDMFEEGAGRRTNHYARPSRLGASHISARMSAMSGLYGSTARNPKMAGAKQQQQQQQQQQQHAQQGRRERDRDAHRATTYVGHATPSAVLGASGSARAAVGRVRSGGRTRVSGSGGGSARGARGHGHGTTVATTSVGGAFVSSSGALRQQSDRVVELAVDKLASRAAAGTPPSGSRSARTPGVARDDYGTVPTTHAGGSGPAAAAALIGEANGRRGPTAASRVEHPWDVAGSPEAVKLRGRTSPIDTEHRPAQPPPPHDPKAAAHPRNGHTGNGSGGGHTNGHGNGSGQQQGSFKTWVQTQRAYGVGEFGKPRSMTQRAKSGKVTKTRSAKPRRSTPAGTLITGTTTSLSMSLQRPPVRGINGVKSGMSGRRASPSVSPRRPRAGSASRRDDKRVARRGPQAVQEARGQARKLERFNSEPTTTHRRLKPKGSSHGGRPMANGIPSAAAGGSARLHVDAHARAPA